MKKPKFDRAKVFKAVDESSKRMANYTREQRQTLYAKGIAVVYGQNPSTCLHCVTCGQPLILPETPNSKEIRAMARKSAKNLKRVLKK